MLAALTDWVAGDLEILLEALPTFLVETPAQVEVLRATVAAGDGPGVRRAAHTLKGVLANFGVPDLRDSACTLERLGATGSLEGAPALLAALETGLETVYGSVRGIIEQLRRELALRASGG
jgi:HPt (histidine-containing phosphotransfer) domain-containing protein